MKSKIGVLIFSGLFMLGFGGVGIFVGMNQLWQTASDGLRAMRMVAVEARVDSVRLVESRSSKGGTTYRVDARYRYTFGQEEFTSNRVGFGSVTTSDSNAGFHRGWVQRLEQAQSSGQNITAWVDPGDPTYAVLDKTVRWIMVFFLLPFALLFPAIGIGAGIIFFKTLFTPASELNAAPKAKRAVPNAALLAPKRKGLAHIAGGLALAVFSSPFIAGGFFGDDTPFPFTIVAALFAVGVVALLVSGVRAFIAERSGAQPLLALTPVQPRAGDRVRVRVTGAAAQNTQVISLVFACYEHDARGAGSSTLRVKTRLNVVASRVRATASSNGHDATFEGSLQIPSEAPATQEVSGGLSYRWSAEIEKSPDVAATQFDFTLLPSNAEGHTQFNTALEPTFNSANEIATMPISKSIATVTQHGKAWTATFPAPGLHAGPICLLVIALSCLGWVAKTLLTSAIEPHEIAYIYAPVALIGLLSVAFAVHFATRIVRTTISPQGIVRTRESVLRAAHWRLPLAHIKSIDLGERYQQNNASHNAVMVSQTVKGKPEPISPAIAQLGVANALVAHMRSALAAVTEYGITPAPNATPPALYGPARRIVAMASLLTLAAMTCGALFMIASARGPALVAAAADQLNLPQSREQRKAAVRANFTPADAKRFDALMDALDTKNVSAMEALLKDGADPNTARWDGYTLLIRAAYNNDEPMVRTLLQYQADPNLAMAAPHERAGVTALSDALYRKNLSMANALVNAGARAENATCCGWTLAHVAAESDSIEVLEFVAARNVPLNEFAKGSRGETPLMVAARYGSLNAIRWLHEKGVDKNVRDPYGYNATGWAAFFKQPAAQKLLVELGADAAIGAKTK